jgi:hypothetical protein
MGAVYAKNSHSDSGLRNLIKRRFLVVNSAKSQESQKLVVRPAAADYNVLVINSSAAMAKEITLAITLKMPLCSIMYAPGVEVAGWLLKKRRIDVVVSSPMLPDGGVEKLIPVCESINPSPDLVIVGTPESEQLDQLNRFGRAFEASRYFEPINPSTSPKDGMTSDDAVKKLGADIRNDINNPLQEIVAMVYVAKAGREMSPVTVEALEAIDKATKGIAATVQGLEERIRKNLPG